MTPRSGRCTGAPSIPLAARRAWIGWKSPRAELDGLASTLVGAGRNPRLVSAPPVDQCRQRSSGHRCLTTARKLPLNVVRIAEGDHRWTQRIRLDTAVRHSASPSALANRANGEVRVEHSEVERGPFRVVCTGLERAALVAEMGLPAWQVCGVRAHTVSLPRASWQPTGRLTCGAGRQGCWRRWLRS